MTSPGDPNSDPPSDHPDGAHDLPIEDALDLHAFAPSEIPDVVRSYLEEACLRGFREVRLIHGRGIGVQRDRVRRTLEGHPAVEAYGDAPAERGHWGATIVRLRPPVTASEPAADPASTRTGPVC